MFSSSLLRSMATLLSVLEKVGGKGFVCGPLRSCLSISCMTNKKQNKKTNPSTLHCCFCSVRLNLRAAKAPKHRRLGSKRSCRKEENRCLSSRLRSSDRACWHFPNCHQCKSAIKVRNQNNGPGTSGRRRGCAHNAKTCSGTDLRGRGATEFAVLFLYAWADGKFGSSDSSEKASLLALSDDWNF